MFERNLRKGVTEIFLKSVDAVKNELWRLGFDTNEDSKSSFIAILNPTDFSENKLREIGDALNDQQLSDYLVDMGKEAFREELERLEKSDKDYSNFSYDELREMYSERGDNDDIFLYECNFVIETGCGVYEGEGKYSTPHGMAIFSRAYDDRTLVKSPSFSVKEGKLKPARFGNNDGYFFCVIDKTDECYPEDVNIEDAESTCDYFLKRNFPSIDRDKLFNNQIQSAFLK